VAVDELDPIALELDLRHLVDLLQEEVLRRRVGSGKQQVDALIAGTVAARAAAFGVPHHRVESIDVNTIRAELAGPITAVRESAFPLVVEFVTHRLGPHSKGDDTRTPRQLQALRDDDWYERYAGAFPRLFAAADEHWRRYVDTLVAEVSARPLASRATR
jgi:pyruvate dehydrogenase E1 component alpha subunit